MTVFAGGPDAVDVEVIQRHEAAMGASWRDPGRRRWLFERAVRLRQADPDLPDFEVLSDERDPAGLLVSSEELLVRQEDLVDRQDALRRSGMVAEPIEALGGRLARLVPDPRSPRRSIVDRCGELRREQVPAHFSYITSATVLSALLGGAEPAERKWPPMVAPKSADSSMRVAVIDTGVTRQTRTDGWLAGLARDPGNIDELDTSPRNGLLDAAAGHGTAVSGLIQKEAPAVPLVVYNPVPPDGAATEVAVAEAMVAAVREAFAAGESVVLNLSLGTTTTDDRPPVALQAAVDEIEALAAASPHEALIVAAAGNYGEDRPVFPAAIPGVVAVGALLQDLSPAPWSSYGDWLTCSAIGDGALSVFVEGQKDPELDPVSPDTFGPDPFALHFGTSFAAPQVAARVARVAEEEGLSLGDALDRVLDSAPGERGYGRKLEIQPAIGLPVRYPSAVGGSPIGERGRDLQSAGTGGGAEDVVEATPPSPGHLGGHDRAPLERAGDLADQKSGGRPQPEPEEVRGATSSGNGGKPGPAADDDAVFRNPRPAPIVLGGGVTARGGGRPTSSSSGGQPAPDAGVQEETSDGSRDEQRKWLVYVEDYDQEAGLRVGEERLVTLSVGTDASATVAREFDPKFMDRAPEIQLFVLTVQVASDDFVIPDEDLVQTLQVPRAGPSRKPVTWRVTPRHDGPCRLTATVDYRGNFLTQLDLTVPADKPGPAELTTDGRIPGSVATLEGRDLLLVVRPAPPGYDLTVGGSVYTSAHMPITDTELAYVVDDVQKALFQVVSMTNDRGEPVFQYGIDIPEDTSARALETLAQAGALLFNQLFFHADSGEDLQEVGRFLKDQANQPDVRLKIMVVSADAPVPWPMLYLGDTADGAELSWNKFLGLQHIIDQVPRQRTLAVHDPKIRSDPQLSVGLNVSIAIDQQFNVTWVADHQSRWEELAGKRQRISLFPRSTGPSVVAALDDAAASDQIVYFLCHATSGGTEGNPGDATLDMGKGRPITLRKLQSVVPQTRFSTSPLIFINACESSDLSPKFYAGFVPYFLAKGARGVIGTECKVPVVFAVEFAERFFDRLLDGKSVGDSVLAVRRELVEQNRNPLGLLYVVHCDADTRIDPALLAAAG